MVVRVRKSIGGEEEGDLQLQWGRHEHTRVCPFFSNFMIVCSAIRFLFYNKNDGCVVYDVCVYIYIYVYYEKR